MVADYPSYLDLNETNDNSEGAMSTDTNTNHAIFTTSDFAFTSQQTEQIRPDSVCHLPFVT